MNRIKNSILTFALTLGAACLLGSGCASAPPAPGQPDDSLADVAFWTKYAATVGTQYALAEDPGRRPIFESTAGALDALLAQGNFDPAAFHAALAQLPIKELQTAEARILITTAVVIYQRYGQNLAIDRAAYVHAAITAVRDGIRAALATSP